MKSKFTPLVAFIFSIGLAIPTEAQLLNNIGKKLEKKANDIIHKNSNKGQKAEPKINTSSTSSVQNGPFPAHSVMNYDFTSGNIVFEDNFSNETIGNMATNWTSNGNGKVANVNGFAGKWLQLIDQNTYKIKNSNGLPKNFTVELDVLVLDDGKKNVALDFGFDYKKGSNEHYYLADRNAINVEASYRFDVFNFTSNELSSKKQSKIEGDMSYFVNDIMKLKIWVFGEQMKVYANEYKILDTEMSNPNSKKYFYIATENEKNAAQIYISNVRITDLGL